MKNQHQVVFYTINHSTIKRFFILDCMIGTGFYFLFKILSSSVLVGVLGSFVYTEGVKRLTRKRDFRF